MSSETVKWKLKWKEYESNIRDAFFNLKEEKDFSDVTLVCGDGQVEAHKVILSACSPFFQRILKQNSHTHPLIYLKGVKFTDLEAIMQFMYLGEVDVVSANLDTFLDVGKELEVKGLIEGETQCPPTTAPRDYNDRGSTIRLKPWSKLAPQPGLSLQTTAAEDHGQYEQNGLHDQDEQVGEEEYEEEEENGGNVSEAVEGNQNLKEVQERRKAFLQQYLAEVGGNKFKCNVDGCGKKIPRGGHAEDHVESIHFPGKFLYRCSKCDQDLKSWQSFRSHGRYKHKIKFTTMDMLKAMK